MHEQCAILQKTGGGGSERLSGRRDRIEDAVGWIPRHRRNFEDMLCAIARNNDQIGEGPTHIDAYAPTWIPS